MGYNIRLKLSSLPFHWQRGVFCLTVIEHTRTARIRATHWHTACDGRTKHGCSKVSICRRAFKQKKWNANGLPITVTTLCPLVGGTVYGALKTVHTKSGRSFLYKENLPDFQVNSFSSFWIGPTIHAKRRIIPPDYLSIDPGCAASPLHPAAWLCPIP